MNKIPELNPIEKKLKQFYRKSKERMLDVPCTRDEIMDVLLSSYTAMPDKNITQSLKTQIDEQIFILENMDVSFVRHARYTPAFWHNHDFFEMIFVQSGGCINYIFDRNISMQTGDICIMAPDITHSLSAFHDKDVIMNILIRKSTFEQSFFGLLDDNTILSDFFKRTFYQTSEIPYLLFHTGKDSVLSDLIDRAYTECAQPKRYKKQMVNTLLSLFFINLFRRHEQHTELSGIHPNSSEENLMYVLRYMQANYKTVSLKELSSIFNYSERQLQRIIQNATGHTFIENIQNQKMKQAADLLQNSTLPVSEISERTGFQSLNNFRKIFFKYFNMTPSEYRKTCTTKHTLSISL